MKTNEGPEVTVKYSCFNCKFEVSESYRCQGDSGQDVYCTHPSFSERKRVGDTSWSTPDFCPFKKDAFRALANES